VPNEPLQCDAILNFDGAARNNNRRDVPRLAGAGAVLKRPDGTVLAKYKRFLGDMTSNVAEYHALIMGLERALACSVRRVEVCGDSELIVKQLRGENKVKDTKLRPLYGHVTVLLARFDWFRILHVPRELNAEADRLANEAIDDALSGEGVTASK
jgi:ribonuclease HI